MRKEIQDEILRRRNLLKQKIANGEVLVCSKDKPMPEDRDQMGQKWFHEEAKCESTTGPNTRIYHCPVCGIRFPVILERFIPNA